MQTLGAFTKAGSGPGLVHVVGSFTTKVGTFAILGQRPSKSNVTITRKAVGVYLITYAQAGLSVVAASASVGAATNIGTGGVLSAAPGYAILSQDFMTTNAGGTAMAADATNTTLVLQVFNSANNALADVYDLGETSSIANYRVSFTYTISTSAMNQ